jgi:hypothetical protein
MRRRPITMSNQSTAILAHLQAVESERLSRSEVLGLEDKVVALKAYQQRRFQHTYADLLRSPRYGPASRFFLTELYGPDDFTKRDSQFARVVPALVRLFPGEIVDTVATLAELHALSEVLDTRMGLQLQTAAIDKVSYIDAWISTGGRAERAAQVSLTLEVANRLDRVTKSVLIRTSLRLMRSPARAGGLSELQTFLEQGFDSFSAMKGSKEFVATVNAREKTLASALFDARSTTGQGYAPTALALALASLP